MSIERLDEFMFLNIYEFCLDDKLLETCRFAYQIKRRVSIYNLKRTYSLKYYNDAAFRNLVLQTITDSRKQLHLNLSSYGDIITDVSALGNVHTLNLSRCDKIEDVSALGNVHTLDLSYCTKITDVSALGNVHTLDLYNCGKITDVSALGNVQNFSACKRLKLKRRRYCK